jgi:hypothetical protein
MSSKNPWLPVLDGSTPEMGVRRKERYALAGLAREPLTAFDLGTLTGSYLEPQSLSSRIDPPHRDIDLQVWLLATLFHANLRNCTR